MALNKLDRCSTCLRLCSITADQNPIQMSCGHHTCSRCHQTQWLTSERNDSEEIDCIKCTLAANVQSSEKHNQLMSRPSLFGLANVGAVIGGAGETRTQTDITDNTSPHTAREDICRPEACSQGHRRVHHHRTWSCPADILSTALEMERKGTQSCKSSTDMTQMSRKNDWSREPDDTMHTNIKGLKYVCGEVLRFTPLDPKKKHNKKSKKKHRKTKQLSPEKSSKESDVHVTNKTEAIEIKQHSDLKSSVQSYHKTYTNIPIVAHTPTHGQDSTMGQIVMDANVTNGSQPKGRSHHKHKSSHKKSKKKDKEKNRTKSRQSPSLHMTCTPDCKTKTKVNEMETLPQLVHLKTSFIVCKEVHGNNEGDALSIAGKGEEDKLSISGNSEGDKFPIAGTSKREEDTLSIAGNDGSDPGNREGNHLSIVGIDKVDSLSVAVISEGYTFSIATNDDSESEGANLYRSSGMSLDDCASSTRFSSPMSLDDYQLSNILEDKDTSELEVQDWGDSDADNTKLEVQDWGDNQKKGTDCSQHQESDSATVLNSLLTKDSGKFVGSYQPSNEKSVFVNFSKNEHGLIVNLPAQREQERSNASRDILSLDDSILDRSGILYYDPIDDSDEERLVIVSRPTSETSLIGEDQTVTNTKETASGIESMSSSECASQTVMNAVVTTMRPADKTHAVSTAAKDKFNSIDSAILVSLAFRKEDQLSATSSSEQEKGSHLGTTERDHDKLLQSYHQYLSEKSNQFIDTGKEEDKAIQFKEKNFVKGFQESYTTSLVCSQLANKALQTIKETGEHQKGPYQLSTKMLTGVLNILVQQANLASTICSELLNSTESMQATPQELSNTTETPDTLSVDATEKVTDHQSRFSANGTSDLGCNVYSLNASIPECSIFAEEFLADGVQSSIKQELVYSPEGNNPKHSAENNFTNLVADSTSEKSTLVDISIRKSSPECSPTIPSSKPSSSKETSMDYAIKSVSKSKHSSRRHISAVINASSKPRSGITLENGNLASTNTPMSKSTDKSGKDKYSKDLLGNHVSNLDSKHQAARNASQTSMKEAMVCTHPVNSVKTKNARQYQKGSHKNRSEQINHSSAYSSFAQSKTLDSPCSGHEGRGKKDTDVKKDSSRSDVPTVGRQDEVNDVVSGSQPRLSDLSSDVRTTPDLSVIGEQQASLGTQVTESDLETARHEPDNQKQEHMKNNKQYTEEKNYTHLGKTKDKDRETKKSTNNQPKSSNGKRNLFDSLLLEIEEGVVESPSKYRKLQFGKIPRSHAGYRTQLDTPGGSSGKDSLDTAETISLSKLRCKNGTNTNEITQKDKGTPQSAVSNRLAGNVAVVSPASKPTPELKLKSTSTLKCSTKRSSSVPSAHCGSDRKDGSNSRSKYHSSCGSSHHRDSSIPHRDLSSHHKSSSSHRHSQRRSDRKATPGRNVPGNVSFVVHGSKRDICIQTDPQKVHQTPGKSKRNLYTNKGDAISQLHKAMGDAAHSVKEGVSQEHTPDQKPSNDQRSEDLFEPVSGCSNPTSTVVQTPGKSKRKPYMNKGDAISQLHKAMGDADDSVKEGVSQEHTPDQKTSNVDQRSEDIFEPVSGCSNPSSKMVPEVVEEEDVSLLTSQNETYTRRDQARDEEIFRCLSFSDSDDDVPLALLLESLRAGQHEGTSTATSVHDLEDDQLPKLTVPNISKHPKHHSHRRSRCDRPGLKTYLEIRNSMPGHSTDNHPCSETSKITWRNSLMPPPLEAVRRSKSCGNATQSAPTNSKALPTPETIAPRSEATSANQSSDSTHDSDMGQGHICDGEDESEDGDNAERGGFSSKKKKRHRRRKSEKSVVSSSSEECIPKGRRRGFQWRQECLRILDRVYNHQFSDPFRHEVKSKETPDYYKIVKRGMCFDIIGYKLRCNIYEELRDFFLDVRLVFDNCRLYHKPESPIYQAGLVVKCFFRRVAKEVLMPRTNARSRHSTM